MYKKDPLKRNSFEPKISFAFNRHLFFYIWLIGTDQVILYRQMIPKDGLFLQTGDSYRQVVSIRQ